MYKKINANLIFRIEDSAFIPVDEANADYITYLQWKLEGNTPLPADPVPVETVIEAMTAKIQERLDGFAKTRGYDGIMSACTYAASQVPKFATEGQYCVSARDSTWLAASIILNDVQAGIRPSPTQDELMADLPVLAWPV